MKSRKYQTEQKQKKGGFLAGILLLAVCLTVVVAGGKTILGGNPVQAIGESLQTDADLTLAPDGDWNLILVNPEHVMPQGYEVELTQLSNGESVDERIYPYLQKMFDDARAQGVFPVVTSGYRTQQTQEMLYEQEIQKYRDQGYSDFEAEELAKKWVAVPGTSEHQLGLAVDIGAEALKSDKEQVYQWLYENSAQYGFILRYPEDKTEITGINYEPWHFRYVGKEAAQKIYEQGICLEEYLQQK